MEQEKYQSKTTYPKNADEKTIRSSNSIIGVKFGMDVKCPKRNKRVINRQLSMRKSKVVSRNFALIKFQNKLKAVVYTYIASQLYSNKDK